MAYTIKPVMCDPLVTTLCMDGKNIDSEIDSGAGITLIDGEITIIFCPVESWKHIT